MATVKIKFRPSTITGYPGCLVYCVTHNNTTRQISSGIMLHRHEWDKEKSMPFLTGNKKRTGILHSIANKVEHDMKSFAGIIDRLNRSNDSYSSDDVIHEFNHSRNSTSLFEFMEEVIDRLSQLNQTGTANNYRSALVSFRKFRTGTDIQLKAIDCMLIEDYQQYLQTGGVTQNTVSFYMRILRAVYNRAVKQGLTADRKPFHSVFTGMEKTIKRAIPVKYIKRIKNLDLTAHPRLEFARDIFLFLFYCRGMSFIDAVFLKKSDISNGTLTYRRSKTGQQLHVKILPQIRALIDRYTLPASPYLLPIILQAGINERRQYETALRRINKTLKTVGELAGLSTRLTTYVSRHSWATIAKRKNVSINVISDALGHESIATTQIYLASIDSSVIDRANELVIKDI